MNTYGDKGFKVLAFPCNQFGGQEPGTHEEIVEFVEKLTGASKKITFFEKGPVNGSEARPVFAYLKDALPNDDGSMDITWNFAKFLVDHEGNPMIRKSPRVSPLQMKENIEALLEKK